MAFSTKSSDSFDRANGALGGSTLDNAAGGSESGNTWTVKGSGTWNVASNKAEHSGAAGRVVVVESTADVADQRVTITFQTSGETTGPIARWATGAGGVGDYYVAHIESNASIILYKVDDGSATQLGSTGGTAVAGDTVGIRCVGDQIAALLNGSVTVGPVTDSFRSTGKPGLHGGDGTRTLDNFLYEVDTGGGGSIAAISSGYHQRGLR